MQKTLLVLTVAVFFGLSQPATAQLRSDVSNRQARVQLYSQQNDGFSLDQIFRPEDFKMSHSVSFSSGSFGGGFAYGMYTNTVAWQPNQKLAARVDVSYLQNFGGTLGMDSRFSGQQQRQFFVRNAELAYRPTENTQLHFQFRQSPFGGYAQPFGRRASGYGAGPATGGDLFWRAPDAR